MRRQLDGSSTSSSDHPPSQYTLPPTSSSSSSSTTTTHGGFEIQGISTRILSSEAVIAPLELFKAISTLTNRQDAKLVSTVSTEASESTDNVLSADDDVVVDNNDNMGGEITVDESISCEQKGEEDNLKVHKVSSSASTETEACVPNQEMIIASEEIKEVSTEDDDAMAAAEVIASQIQQPKHNHPPINELDRMKQKLKRTLDEALQRDDGRAHRKVIKVFHESAINTQHAHELLDKENLLSIFFYLIHHNIPAAYDVLKFHANRCKEQERLVRLDMYQRIIHRLRPHGLYNDHTSARNGGPSRTSSHVRRMKPLELQRVVNDMVRHIKEEYGSGKKQVYQHILLPELVLSLMEHRNADINTWAVPIMNYILDNDFPILDPGLYEYLLSKGRRPVDARGDTVVVPRQWNMGTLRTPTDPTGQNVFPYHRILSMLIASGMIQLLCINMMMCI